MGRICVHPFWKVLQHHCSERKNQDSIKLRRALVGKLSRMKMGKWGAEPWVCWRNPAYLLQISPWQLSDIINRTPGRSLWWLLEVQSGREECCTFSWVWMCPCAFWLRVFWLQELLKMRNAPRTAPFPQTRVSPALELTEGCVLRVAHLLDKQGKQTLWSK